MRSFVLSRISKRPMAAQLNSLLFAVLVLIVSAFALARAWSFKAADPHDVLQGKLAHAFESHYDNVFPVRTLGVSLWAALDYALFGEGRPGVVVGKQDWLYTDEEFKLDNDAPATVERNLALVDWVHKELARRGVGLVVAVVPAKARVYPEYLERHPPALHRDLYARVQDSLRAGGIASADLLAPLEAGKSREPTYLRTDTHWTPYGASLAAGVIADAARAFDTGADHREFHTRIAGKETHRGDLFNFLPLDPYFAFLLPPPDEVNRFRTETSSAADAGGGLLGDAPAAQVALVGTSYSAESLWNFAGALEEALHEDVMNYAKDGAGPFAPMLAYLQSDDLRASPPKLVVWEMPERYLAARQELQAYHLPPEVQVRIADAQDTSGVHSSN
jgi:alginate O-acetyltransferase complex protein AlgJ